MTTLVKRTAPVLISLLVLSAIFTLAVIAGDRPVTQRLTLEELSRTFAQQLRDRRPQLYFDLLADTSLPQRRLNKNPDIQLMFINERGKPVFYQVENLNAARTISTDDVWPGGSGGFSLTGATVDSSQLGVWDGGGVRLTHREFEGRVTQIEGTIATHYHSTHVAGTMIAMGVSASAQGMSYEAQLSAYDWNSDNEEMALAAAAGMNVSSHSYGFPAGWRRDGDWYWYGDINISPDEDYGFGFYGYQAQAWDEIAYNAPYYTIVKSAGNDRDDYGPNPGEGHYVWIGGGWMMVFADRDPDGGADHYDCIPWYANAKNIITVGAVGDLTGGYSSPAGVSMSSFSSWGPADDGRIKPDIVANGTSLRSCDDDRDDDYTYLSGTSMSAPNVSGSLNLLVRYFEATHENLTPLSSTMKALIMHTADEAGPDPGPDYMFGWGLMNTLKATELIQLDSMETKLIREESLDDGETEEYTLESDGSEPIRIALAWTDPPGTSPPASLNPPDLMLVNDLDLRLEYESTAAVYEPYVLNPANPADAATTGDNFRDNCELIYLEAPPAGTYIVTVSHKGILAAPQYYSLVSSHNISNCDCTDFCDLNLDDGIDPLDVAILVAYVYQQQDARAQLADCPLENGDWDCNGSVDPIDVTFYVKYVYQQQGAGPCDPCAL